MVGGGDLLSVELADVVHHVFVDRLIAEKDLEASRPESLQIRAGLDRIPIRAHQVIDLLLVGTHPRNIVGKRRRLALVGEGRLEPEELRQLVLVGEVERRALLQEHAELLVELGVRLGPVLRLLVEELEKTLGDDPVQLLDERPVLHRLAGDVEREVLAVDDPLQEAEPLRQQVLWPGVDQDLPAVERHGRLKPGKAHLLRVALGNEEQGVDRDRRIRAEMEPEPGRLRVVGLELVELVVLLVLDLAFAPKPERLDRVDPLSIQVDWKRDKRAVPLQDLPDPPFLAEFGALVLQLDDHLAAPALARALVDRIAAGPVAGPKEPGLGLAPGMGVNPDGFRDHEGRVESDAELPDEPRGLLVAFAQGLQECLGAGVRDRPEILHQFGLGHPDPEVLDREGLCLVIGGYVDLQGQLVVVDGLFRQLEVALLLKRVGCVGNQLADEDLLLRVKGMDDDIEQLLDFGLELEGLGCGGGHLCVGSGGVSVP